MDVLLGHVFGEGAEGAAPEEQIDLLEGELLGLLEHEEDGRQGDEDVWTTTCVSNVTDPPNTSQTETLRRGNSLKAMNTK